MAVYAAHLTRTLQGTPTLFQVTAQEALGATVKPALQKVVEFLAANYPNKCGWCVKWYDELYLVFDCCLQYYYLKHYAASFSESFYGLVRVPISANSEFSIGQHLPIYLERASLAALVLLPYLRDKVERVVEKWREDDEDGRLGKTPSDKLRRAAIRTYSVVYTAVALARLVQLARYAAGASAAHSPPHALLALALRPAPPRDAADFSWSELVRHILTGRFGSAALSLPMVGGLALGAMEYGAFAVQFLRWWDTSAAQDAALPPPPPAQASVSWSEVKGGAAGCAPRLSPAPCGQLLGGEVRRQRGGEGEERAARWRNKCPLCLQSWRIPTVLPVSGYIFCYTCISRHVRSTSHCPVSRCPAREADLVRLYID